MAPPAPFAEISGWRFAGAACWSGLLFTCVLYPLWAALATKAGMGSMLTVAGVTGALLQAVLQLLVQYAHLINLAPCEPAPLHVPSLGLHSKSWLSALLSRVLLRGRNMQVRVAGFLFATLGLSDIMAFLNEAGICWLRQFQFVISIFCLHFSCCIYSISLPPHMKLKPLNRIRPSAYQLPGPLAYCRQSKAQMLCG